MKGSQSQRVLIYIKNYGKINRLQAFTVLGVFELARCIRDLEKLGYSFKKTTIKLKNSFGEWFHCKEYTLVQ